MATEDVTCEAATTAMVERVKSLLEIAKDACYRPLYLEISNFSEGILEQSQPSQFANRVKSNEKTTWNEVRDSLNCKNFPLNILCLFSLFVSF
jgi:hypothetical protein